MISKLENHPDPNPKYNTLKRIASGLNLTTAELLRKLANYEK